MKVPFSRFTVRGNSMFPTLKPGQDILVFNWKYFFAKPKVRDIVVTKSKIVKRVQKVEGDKVYLIGDNRQESTDSRSFGPVFKAEIVGKVVYVR